jgi:predicted RNase H-like HicB family nuclease
MMMIYTAFFTPDKEHNTCLVQFPDLDYSCTLDISDMAEFRHQLKEELGFALWMYDDAGKPIPTPKTNRDKELPPDSYIDFVQCDYEKFKQNISVREIDLSE